MEILVTGGAGYLGAVLCPELLGRGHHVRCLDALIHGRGPIEALLTHPGFQLLEGSITDTPVLSGAVLGCDAVIHLAGLADDRSCDAQPELARALNVDAALSLATVCRLFGVRRFVNASSCSVYGQGAEEVLSETSPVRPVSLYARYKVQVECALNEMAGPDFVPVHLRQATLFGYSPRMRLDLVVNAMTRDALRGGPLTVRGGGRQWRPFLHVADAASAFAVAVAAPEATVCGQAFNVGADRANHRIREIAEFVSGEFPGVPVVVAPDEPDPRSYRVSFGKIGRLGWSSKRSVRDGVREMRRALSARVRAETALAQGR